MDLTGKFFTVRASLAQILATKFPVLIIISIILGISAALIVGRPDFAIRGIIYIVPGILIAIILMSLYHKGEKYPDTFILVHTNSTFLQISFVSIFALSILALYFSPYRTGYYFLLVTALFSVIFLQIFHERLKPSVILFEISCVLGNLIFGLQLKYPFYFGFTDIIPHLFISKIVLLSGHIVPEERSFGYAWFPLYHIFIASGTNLLGIDLRLAFIILTSVSFILIIWVIYLLFNQILRNNQTSLLICLFFSISPVVIVYSTYVITRVMAFFGFIFFLYLAHKQIQTSKWRSFSVLTMVFSIYLVLVHQVSILQILAILFLFVLLEIIINDYFAIKTRIIVFILVTFTTYWIFTSFVFTSVILQILDSTTVPGFSRLRTGIQTGNEYTFLMENISTALIIFLVILGVGYLLWAYKSKYPSVIGLLVLLASPLYFPGPLTASSLATVTLRIDRFQLLLSPFFAFALAIGFLLVLNTLGERKHIRKVAIFLGLLLFSYLCFSALTQSSSDSLDIPADQGRVYFTESELNAFDFIPQFVNSNMTISSDSFASRMFDQPFFSETKALNLPSYHATSAIESDTVYEFNDGYFILRNEELKDKGLKFDSWSIDYGEYLEPNPDVLLKFSDLTFHSQKIYDNRKVSILSNIF